jgi:hypothetical protein
MEQNVNSRAATDEAARLARRTVVIRKLQKDDIFNSLVAGWNDLKRAPSYGLTVGVLHALAGRLAIFSPSFPACIISPIPSSPAWR